MEKAEHRNLHLKLHNSLDILVADFIEHTEKIPSETSLMDFMNWAYKQTIKPSEKK